MVQKVVSGYRALRTSVVRQWIGEMTGADRGAPDDAVDQALTESVRLYSDSLTGSRADDTTFTVHAPKNQADNG